VYRCDRQVATATDSLALVNGQLTVKKVKTDEYMRVVARWSDKSRGFRIVFSCDLAQLRISMSLSWWELIVTSLKK
jgi:hypothetical protein